jgi:hypothetical protein
VLADPRQRAGFLALLDSPLPPDGVSGLAAGERWHPVLGRQPGGNVYLVVRSAAGQVDFGSARRSGARPARPPPRCAAMASRSASAAITARSVLENSASTPSLFATRPPWHVLSRSRCHR